MKLCPTCHAGFAEGIATCPNDGATLEPDAMLGTQLGSYRVESWLAEGGLGVLYRGVHVTLNRPVVLKLLRREHASTADIATRFAREAKIVAEIGHPHLVDVFDVGRTPDGRLYYVMELLVGRSLAKRQETAPLRWPDIVAVLSDTCEALAAAHAAGVIHRDLKPENLFLIEREGEPPFVKVLDFGVAKLVGLDEELGGKLTKTGMLIGTPQYMAPEQIDGEAGGVDPRTDVYAMGVILYELLTGELPFKARTVGAMLKAHLSERPPAVGSRIERTGAPAGVDALLTRALAKRKDERFLSIVELRGALARVAEGLSVEGAATEAFADTHRAFRIADAGLPKRKSDIPTTEESAPPQMGGAPTETAPTSAATLAAPEPAAAKPAAPRRGGALTLAVGGLVLLAGGAGMALLLRPTPRPPASSPAPTPSARPSLAALRSRALKVISAGLADGDPAVRRSAIDAVVAGGDRAHRTLLEPLLADPDTQIRSATAAALARLGAGAALPALRAARGKDPGVDAWIDAARLELGDRAARQPLELALRAPNQPARLKVAIELCDREDGAARALLAEAAGQPETDPASRLELWSHLARAGDAQARASLVAALDDPRDGLRAAEILARQGDERAAPRLRALADGGRTTLRDAGASAGAESPSQLAALEALARLGDQSGYGAFVAALRDGGRPLADRVLAARGLAACGDKGALPALAARLDDAEPALRLGAAGAIVAILAAGPRALASASADWASAALASDDWVLREQAASLLGDLDARYAIPLLGRAIGDSRVEVRRAALRALGRTRSRDALPVLSRALDDRAGDLRIVAAGQMARLGDRSHLDRIRAGLSSTDPLVRRAAIEESAAQAELAGPAAAAALADPVLEVRLAAALGLAERGSRAGEQVLREALAIGGVVALSAYAALTRLGLSVAHIPDIAKLLDGADAQTRRAAIAALVRLTPAVRIEPLRRSLADADASVRFAALDAIADLALREDDAGARALLRTARASDDGALRARAAAALARLLPPDPEEPEQPEAAGARAPAAGVESGATEAADAAPPSEAPATAAARDEATFAAAAGDLALRSGKYATAARELERARRLDPRAPVAVSLGDAYRALADAEPDHAKQVALYRKAVASYRRSRDPRAIAQAAELEELWLK